MHIAAMMALSLGYIFGPEKHSMLMLKLMLFAAFPFAIYWELPNG